MFKIFSIIKEHEKIRATGADPYQIKLKSLEGSYDYDKGDEDMDDGDADEEDAALITFPEAAIATSPATATNSFSARQTMLFSATAVKLQELNSKKQRVPFEKDNKKSKNNDFTTNLDRLPDHLQKLLKLIGTKKKV